MTRRHPPLSLRIYSDTSIRPSVGRLSFNREHCQRPHSKSRPQHSKSRFNIRNRAPTLEIALQHSESRFNTRNRTSDPRIAFQHSGSVLDHSKTYPNTRKHPRTIHNIHETHANTRKRFSMDQRTCRARAESATQPSMQE